VGSGGDVVEVVRDGHRADPEVAAVKVAVFDDRADHRVGEAELAANLVDDVLHLIACADDHDAGQGDTSDAAPREPPAPGPALDDEAEQAERKREQEEVALVVELQHGEGYSQNAEGHRARTHHSAVLGHADAQHPRLPRAVHPERGDPPGDEHGEHADKLHRGCRVRTRRRQRGREGGRRDRRREHDGDIAPLQAQAKVAGDGWAGVGCRDRAAAHRVRAAGKGKRRAGNCRGAGGNAGGRNVKVVHQYPDLGGRQVSEKPLGRAAGDREVVEIGRAVYPVVG